MQVEKLFLFKILSEESTDEKRRMLTKALDAGVDDDWFMDAQWEGVFVFVKEYYRRHGVVPGLDLVEVERDVRFPDHEISEPIEFWIDELRLNVRWAALETYNEDIAEMLKAGQDQAAADSVSELHQYLLMLSRSRRDTTKLSEISEGIIDHHNRIRSGTDHRGIMMGIPYLDAVTGGAQGGDLWAMAGESGSGKTFMSMRFCKGAVDSGFKAVYVSMEMTNHQIGQRALALGAQIPGMALRLGRLSYLGVDRIEEFMRDWRSDGRDDRFIMVEGKINMTVDDVIYRVQEHKPDILFVDGAYMLKTKGFFKSQWERILAVLEDLKGLAIDENIPVVLTFQFDQKVGREKEKHHIMGGQSIGQIASVIIGLSDEDGASTEFTPIQYKIAELIKGRSGEQGKIRLLYNMDRTIIEQDEVLFGVDALIDEPRGESSDSGYDGGGHDVSGGSNGIIDEILRDGDED